MAIHEATVEFHHGSVPPVRLVIVNDLLIDLQGLAATLYEKVALQVQTEGDDPDLSTLALEVRPHRSGEALTMTLRMETR